IANNDGDRALFHNVFAEPLVSGKVIHGDLQGNERGYSFTPFPRRRTTESFRRAQNEERRPQGAATRTGTPPAGKSSRRDSGYGSARAGFDPGPFLRSKRCQSSAGRPVAPSPALSASTRGEVAYPWVFGGVR